MTTWNWYRRLTNTTTNTGTMKANLLFGLIAVALSACSSLQNEPIHVAYGKILSVHPHLIVRQEPNMTGAVVGGVAGAVIGHQFGKGEGKTAMTVLGGAVGAVTGSQINKKETVQQVSDLVVQMPSGAVFTITTQDVGFQPGQNVKIVQRGHIATIEAIDN